MRVIPDSAVDAVLDLEPLLEVVAEAFRRDRAGAVERPDRPHYPVGVGVRDENPLGTGLVMPAYIHGSDYAATKLVGVHEGNKAIGLPTVNAEIVLKSAETGIPEAVLAGTRITNARTGCIGGLAARELATESPVTLGVIGAGAQARWQSRAIAAATGISEARIYSPSDSRESCAADLRAEGIDARAVDSAEDAVADASVVVTATTATDPVISGAKLSTGALVVAVGAYTTEMRELDTETLDRAAQVFGDVPEEAAETGDFPDHDASAIEPFSDVVAGYAGRQRDDDLIVVKSVGTAVLDAAAAEDVYERAIEEDVGTEVEMNGV